MATLQNIRGGSLVTDLTDVFGLADTRVEQQRAAEAEKQRRQGVQTATEAVLTAQTPETLNKARARLASLDPKVAAGAQKILESNNEQAIAAARTKVENGARMAKLISEGKTFADRQRINRELAAEAQANGEDITDFLDRANLSEDQFDLDVRKDMIMAQDLKTMFAPAGGGKQVQSSKILPGGVVQIVFKDGSIETREATPENLAIIKDAEQRGNELAIIRAGGKAEAVAQKRLESEVSPLASKAAATPAAATAAVKQSVKAFEQLAPIKQSITNIDEAIKLVDEGAGTGPVMSRLPSIRSASIKLDNVQKAMGLDVIGTTTFGALSKGELDLALSKALPTNLSGPALRKWLVEKKAAQEKLSSYLEGAATFLGTPGNTIAGFIEQQKAQETTPPAQTDTPGRIKFLGFE